MQLHHLLCLLCVLLAIVFVGDVNAVYVLNNTAARAEYVVETIKNYNANYDPIWGEALVQKYIAMGSSMFEFYQGTNYFYWAAMGQHADLATFGDMSPTAAPNAASTSTKTWICGDMHERNFGLMANDKWVIVFDINDFDETMIADYQLDVWRLASSLVVIMMENGFDTADQQSALNTFSSAYVTAMQSYIGNTNENGGSTVWTAGNTKDQLQTFINKKSSEDSVISLLDEWTVANPPGGTVNRAFNYSNSEIAAAPTAMISAITVALVGAPTPTPTGGPYVATLKSSSTYSTSFFTIKDIACRLYAGTGSLGQPRYYVLLEGNTTANTDDMILDIKFERNAAGFQNVDPDAISTTNTVTSSMPGLRVITGARNLGQHTDPYFGYIQVSGAPMVNATSYFFVRWLNPWKEYFEADDSSKSTYIADLTDANEQWGQIANILASAHARGSSDTGSSGLLYSSKQNIVNKIGSNVSGFQSVVSGIAMNYAQQVQFDYQAFQNWQAGTTSAPSKHPTTKSPTTGTNPTNPTTAPSKPTASPTVSNTAYVVPNAASSMHAFSKSFAMMALALIVAILF